MTQPNSQYYGVGGILTPGNTPTPSGITTTPKTEQQMADAGFQTDKNPATPAPAPTPTPPAPVPTPTPNPAPSTTPPAGTTGGTGKPQETYKDIFGNAYGDLTSKAQGQISSIEGYYQNLLKGADVAGGQKESASNAMALAAHLSGSGTAMAGLEKVKGETRQEKLNITNEMAKNISSVYERVSNNALNLANAEYADQASIKKDALASLDVLATSGKTSQDIKTADPTFYQNLLDQTGYTDYQMATALDNSPNNPNKPIIKEIPMPSEDGKSTILKRLSIDPKTGKTTEQDFTVAVPPATFAGEGTVKTTDGQILQQMPDGTYKNITPGLSQATTTSQKDYEYYSKQESGAGRTPLSFADWTANAKAPAAVKEYLAAKAGGFTGSIVEYQQSKKGAGAGAGLDADTVAFLASQYIASPGSAIPSFGQGAAGMAARAQFYKAVADQAEGQGLSGQALAARKAGSTAAQSALTKMTTQVSQIRTAEQTAISNADLAIKYGENYERPADLNLANKWENWVNGQTSSKELTQFEMALFTAAKEYAKVASGSFGSGGLTEGARQEAAHLLNSAMTQEQLKGAIEVMKQDMKNVEGSQDDTIQSLKDQISGGDTGSNGSGGGNSGGGSSGGGSFDSGYNFDSIDTSDFK